MAELAERRARRAAETGLIERAERAERTVAALERRLDEAEGRLEVAQRERATLSASLEQAQRDLTAALQREFAEQRMRQDAESEAGGEFAELEAEITRLGADHDAAEARAAALARALQDARHEVDTARVRAEADRQALAVEDSRDGLRHELGELQALAEDLRGSLLDERAAREAAEQTLVSERERAEAEVTLLQHELDRRAQVHGAVSAQIAELRGALDSVRERTERGERSEELEQALVTLEAEQRRTGARLADTRELLGAREAELIAVEDRLVAREAELDALGEEAEGHRAARRQAEESVASVRARSAELEAELEEERQARLRVEERFEAERRRFAGTEEELRAELETRREASDQRLDAVQRTVDALRAELAAAATELDERVAAERTARLAVELDQARSENADRAEREGAVESLVAELVETAHGLRAGFEQELEALAAARDAELARERQEYADMERRVGGLRRELSAVAEQLRDELEEERSARWVAEAELAREVAERAVAEERTGQALDALRAELERLRGTPEANPIYDLPPAGPLLPRADHPALARPADAPTGASAVVGDLARAMDRLRGSGTGEPMDTERAADRGRGPQDDPDPGTEMTAEELETAEELQTAEELAEELETEASEPAETDLAPVVRSVRSPSTAWFGPRLAAFARTDEAAAERVLLAALAAQAPCARKRVAYELELPVSGRYRVEVVPGDGVSVAPVDTDRPSEVDFRLEAPVPALTPLAGGAAPRRLSGVAVRGRRRRLRRLLRSLGSPVGLDELRSAGAQPSSADLLALLCDGVPTGALAGADFTVAYDVVDPRGGSARTLVRARPDGRLAVTVDDGSVPDASLSLDGADLLAVLSGSSTIEVTGDLRAAATLHRWLRCVQDR